MAELREAALLLRFRTTRPTAKSFKYLSYKRIASFLKLSEYEVQHICRKSLKPVIPLSPDKLVYRLEQ